MSDRLADYVIASRKNGYTDEQIREDALRSGISESDIGQCLAAPGPRQVNKKLIVLFSVLAVLMAASVLINYVRQKDNMQYVWACDTSSYSGGDLDGYVSAHKVKLSSRDECSSFFGDSEYYTICSSLLEKDIGKCEPLNLTGREGNSSDTYDICRLFHYVAGEDQEKCSGLDEPYRSFCRRRITESKEQVIIVDLDKSGI